MGDKGSRTAEVEILVRRKIGGIHGTRGASAAVLLHASVMGEECFWSFVE